MYTAASMPAETGPVASASLGSAIENGGRERLGQLWHPASKCRTATERLGVCGTGRHQSRDGLASIRNCDFVPLSNLSNQCRQVLPGFTYSCFFHPAIVLHVDRKSTRLNSSHSQISYAVFCLKKKKTIELRLNSRCKPDGTQTVMQSRRSHTDYHIINHRKTKPLSQGYKLHIHLANPVPRSQPSRVRRISDVLSYELRSALKSIAGYRKDNENNFLRGRECSGGRTYLSCVVGIFPSRADFFFFFSNRAPPGISSFSPRAALPI